ncbi:MAG: FadR family transcriptional regulator, partial [Spirochaetales bacterium]|nr:FadR family transcriptional regulator [Spirochaetales bacterium]
MKELLEPISTESLKDVFVSQFEDLILSGKIVSGETLPSERDLALQMGVSRPVVHEGLLELSAKGLVTIKP